MSSPHVQSEEKRAERATPKPERSELKQPSSPPPPSLQPHTFSRLADIEVQLVMQLLDIDTRLHLALSSRQLLHAASESFASRAGPFYEITSEHLITPREQTLSRITAHISSSLLRHCPILVEWVEGISAGALAGVPNLRAVRSGGHWNNEAGWRQLIAHPAAQHLWEIDAYWHPLPEDMQQLAQLPQLYKLGFRTDRPDATLLVPLIQAPALTDFRLDFSPADRELHLPQLAVIAQLPHLRRLKLGGVDLKQGELHTLLGGPGLSRTLECLHLVSVGLQQDPTADAGAFAVMSRLHTVIVDVVQVDRLMPLLTRAPSLRQLHVVCDLMTQLSMCALQSLMHASPQLHVTVDLSSIQQVAHSLSSERRVELLEERITALRAYPPERVTCITERQ